MRKKNIALLLSVAMAVTSVGSAPVMAGASDVTAVEATDEGAETDALVEATEEAQPEEKAVVKEEAPEEVQPEQDAVLEEMPEENDVLMEAPEETEPEQDIVVGLPEDEDAEEEILFDVSEEMEAAEIEWVYGDGDVEGETWADTITSKEITLDTLMDVKIENAGDQVYFKYTVPQDGGGLYCFRSMDEDIDTKGYLYDADGTCIKEDDDSGINADFSLVYTLENRKTYYFAAGMYGEDTGSFQVKLSKQKELQSIAAELNATEFDWLDSYKSAYATITLTYKDNTTESIECIKKRDLYNEKLGKWLKCRIINTSNANDVYEFGDELAAGEWNVIFSCGEIESTPCTVRVKTFSETMQDAEVLTLGSKATANFTADKSVVYFKYTVPVNEGGFYRFESIKGEMSVNDEDPYGYIYDESGEKIASNDDGGGERNFLINCQLIGGKTYYFAATLYEEGTGSYNVELKKRTKLVTKIEAELKTTVFTDEFSWKAAHVKLTLIYNDGTREIVDCTDGDSPYSSEKVRVECAIKNDTDWCDFGDYLYVGNWKVTFRCDNAELSYNIKVDHAWGEWKTITAATCTTAGTRERICKDCDEKETGTVNALGHSFGAWQTVQEATAVAPGSRVCKCTRCSVTKTESIAKIPATITLNVSGTLPLKTKQSVTVKVSDLAAGDRVESWKSSNTKIVTVSKSGKLTAKKKTGKATITVTLASGKIVTFKVKVQKAAVKTSKVTVDCEKKLTLKKKESRKLSAVVAPISSKQKVKFTSSNKKIVTVSSKGVIKAKKKGKATITVKSGSKTYKIKVTVK